MKKIFWLIHDVSIGGAERMTVDLLPALADRGFSVTLFLIRREGPFLKKLDPRIRLLSANRASLRTSLRPLAEALRDENPDVVVSNLTHLNLVAVTLVRLLRLRARCFVVEHSTPSLNNSRSLKERLLLFAAGFIYRGADRVFGVSEGVCTDLIRGLGLPADRVSVLYNPIDLKMNELLARESTGITAVDCAEVPLIVAIGRLEPAKNFTFLLEAFASVREQAECLLVLIGDGSEAQSLRDTADRLGVRDDVLFAGFRENPYSFIARSSVVACSSLYEGFNRTLAEALALGARVVSVNCPSGPAEILENGRYGTLTEPGDLAGYAAALLEGLTPLSDAERERNRARGAMFAAERIAAKMISYF